MEKLMDLLSLFRKGNEVANPEAWKDGGNAATVLVPAIMMAVKVAGDYGIGITLDTTTAAAIAAGIVALVHFVLNNITSKRGGLLPAKVVVAPGAIDSSVSNRVSAETAEPTVANEAPNPKSEVRPFSSAADAGLPPYFG